MNANVDDNSKVKISVILPVYNVEGYIERCVESLQTQTLDGLEFIFVDDCSTDGSMTPVEAWGKKDERVCILRNDKNIGAGPSRNRGIEVARGEYLSFIDPDDYISHDFYELLYAAATKDGRHDIAKGTRKKVDEKGAPIAENKQALNERFQKPRHSRRPLYRKFTYEHQTAIYHCSLFRNEDVRYGTMRYGEDTVFLLRCCYQTEDIVLEETATYFYVQREGSAVSGDGMDRMNGEMDSLTEKANYLKSKKIDAAALGYLLVQARTCIKRFQQLLGKGCVKRSDYGPVSERLTEIIRSVPRMENACKKWPQLEEILSGCPLTTPGKRSLGEGDVRISVILPVYNPGSGISKCIESLRSQLLDGLEFIFVDDCSTDASMEAVEVWAAEDERVRILRNDVNIGAGPSRNRGIEEARGDYFSFVDPDDYISLEFYHLLYAVAKEGSGHDIAKGSSCKVFDGEKIVESKLDSRIRSCLATGRPLYTAFFYEHWSAIYRRTLFIDSSVRYGLTRHAQDTTFLLRCCYQTEDIVINEAAVYYYVQRDSSAVHKIDMKRIKVDLDALSEKAAFFKDKTIDNYAQMYLAGRFRIVNNRVYLWMLKVPSSADVISEYTAKLKDVVEKSHPLHFLQNESLEYRVLVEQNTPLPDVSCLPKEQKIAGAISWINFILDRHITESSYISGCASAIAIAIRQLLGAQGWRGFKDAYSQTVKELKRLPLKQSAVIRIKVKCKLVTTHNIRTGLSRLMHKLKSYGG